MLFLPPCHVCLAKLCFLVRGGFSPTNIFPFESLLHSLNPASSNSGSHSSPTFDGVTGVRGLPFKLLDAFCEVGTLICKLIPYFT